MTVQVLAESEPVKTVPHRWVTGPELLAVQGLFYLLTGLWPLFHYESFEAVTGPKTDRWLVYTVGSLVSVVGALLLRAVAIRQVTRETKLMAAGVAGALATIDIVFVARGIIAPIYLLDAAVEAAFVVLRLGPEGSQDSPATRPSG